MPGCPRPNKKAMKIAYTIMKTPKDRRQDNQPKPDKRKLREWFVDSSAAN